MAALISADALTHVFDYLNVDVEGLQPCLRISHHWRAVAMAHPAYWRYVSVFDFDIRRGALPYFLNRLEYGAKNKPDVPVRLSVASVSVGNKARPDSLSRNLLDAIAKNIYRLDALYLLIDPINMRFLTRRLPHALELPRLKALDLRLWVAEGVIYRGLEYLVFPLHAAPMLTSVALHDIYLPESTQPITQQLDALKLTFQAQRRPGRDVDLLSVLFPRVCKFELILEVPPRISRRNSYQLATVFHLEGYLFVPCGNLLTTPSIRLYDCDRLSAHRIIYFLPRELLLCVGLRVVELPQQDWYSGQVIIATPDGDFRRQFDGIALTDDATFEPEFLHQLFTRLADRVVSLRISFEEGLIPALLSDSMDLPALETLCIETCGRIGEDMGTSLSCPQIRKLSLLPYSAKEVCISQSNLDDFLNQTLGLASRGISPEIIIGNGLVVLEDTPSHECTEHCGVVNVEDGTDSDTDDLESLQLECGIGLTEPDVDWLYEYL
ncbi:hypothetical protein EXIGLDRAFT_754776 [Exidia glandulosa HHB12029]|uniref:F-box domain-containing protein n=1 Tax=Exidia glandulosa HHB12029 TaxID=1314781 RepID=A0A165CM43_EXIGL|nr:hypothetical protein EXIGLDRAFT_754776 [Exidia glandulosa HHB12029]